MKRIAPWLLFLAAGCGSSPRKPEPGPALILLRQEGRHEIVPGRIELSSHRLTNQKGRVEFVLEVKNLRNQAQTVRIEVRFFDADFQTEYEKVPMVFQESLDPSGVRTLKGAIDFSGMPDGAKVARLGVLAQ